MRTLAATLLVAFTLAPAVRAADVKLDTEDQKTLYALGLALSRNLGSFNLTPEELTTVEAGMADGLFAKEKKVDLEKYGPKIQELAQSRAKVSAEKEKEASKPYLEKMAQEKGAKKLDSGVIYIEEKAGTGDSPKATDKVKVHYTGKLTDGTVFDSSVERGQPATFPLNQVIKCWTEGVQQMKPGGKAKLICPADVAYGDRGAPPKIKPGATLTFDVELLDIVKDTPPAPKPPAATPPTTTAPKAEEPKK
jgi:FKBP-type peptidyl-prolyl cis-trans isomerase FkpA